MLRFPLFLKLISWKVLKRGIFVTVLLRKKSSSVQCANTSQIGLDYKFRTVYFCLHHSLEDLFIRKLYTGTYISKKLQDFSSTSLFKYKDYIAFGFSKFSACKHFPPMSNLIRIFVLIPSPISLSLSLSTANFSSFSLFLPIFLSHFQRQSPGT